MKALYSFVILIIACSFFPSCKKQYSCQCSTTFEEPGYYPYTVSSNEPINSKTTKKRAEQICAHSEKQLHKNNLDYKDGAETVTTSCAVK